MGLHLAWMLVDDNDPDSFCLSDIRAMAEGEK